MAKIMLVEDDNNLREIYGARLQAEGYEIVSAQDGEEALALAVKERPDLIISDVMMPRISGFDMLDILRNAPETKETKVIMMTALSQAEDKSRADKLGADRYLVKSQVTLEDVANVVREVLEGTTNTDQSEAPAQETTPVAQPLTTATSAPSVPQAQPQASSASANEDQNEVKTEGTTQQVPAPAPAVQPATTTSQTSTEQPESADNTQPEPEEVPAPTADPAPSPDPSAPVPEPSTNERPLDPPVKQEIPNEIAENPPVEEKPQTVESIANPEIEVHDESDPNSVQAPPAEQAGQTPSEQPIDSQPAQQQPPAPQISAAKIAETTPQPANQNVPEQSQPADPGSSQSESSDEVSDLPPIVEPKQTIPIKVEMPVQATQSDDVKPTEESSAPQSATENPPQSNENSTGDNTPQPETTPPVGPNLAEAMETEKKEVTKEVTTENNQSSLSTPAEAVQAVSNGAPTPTVITPTVPKPDQTADENENAPADNSITLPQGAGTDATGKKVIQPLSDPTTKPDINALLQAEEQKAAVVNPAANTVISPGQQSANSPAQAPAAKSNDLNNIAL